MKKESCTFVKKIVLSIFILASAWGDVFGIKGEKP